LYDILIKNGKVIDGTGNPWFKADVAVEDGKIVEVGELRGAEAGRAIDADGLFVAPGFMDPHNHSDATIFIHNKNEVSIQQGVTTVIVGHCGLSPFPVTDKNRKHLQISTARSCQLDLDKVVVDWSSFSEYRRRVEDEGVGTNMACLVGHNAVRWAVMGKEEEGGEREIPSTDEMEEMKRLVAQAMEEGAWGFSTGLVYARVETQRQKRL